MDKIRSLKVDKINDYSTLEDEEKILDHVSMTDYMDTCVADKGGGEESLCNLRLWYNCSSQKIICW